MLKLSDTAVKLLRSAANTTHASPIKFGVHITNCSWSLQRKGLLAFRADSVTHGAGGFWITDEGRAELVDRDEAIISVVPAISKEVWDGLEPNSVIDAHAAAGAR